MSAVISISSDEEEEEKEVVAAQCKRKLSTCSIYSSPKTKKVKLEDEKVILIDDEDEGTMNLKNKDITSVVINSDITAVLIENTQNRNSAHEFSPVTKKSANKNDKKIENTNGISINKPETPKATNHKRITPVAVPANSIVLSDDEQDENSAKNSFSFQQKNISKESEKSNKAEEKVALTEEKLNELHKENPRTPEATDCFYKKLVEHANRNSRIEYETPKELFKDSLAINNENSKPSDTVEPEPGCSKSDMSIEENLNLLIERIGKTLKNDVMKAKFKKSSETILKHLRVCISESKDLTSINENILEKNRNLETNTGKAILYFNEIFTELKTLRSVQVTSSDKMKRLEKLWKTLYDCKERIKKLEQTEVNFDDDDDSIYIQTGRYKERATKIYEYICKITEQDSKSINPLYSKLDFDKSRYSEINKALNRKFKDNSKFPDYTQVLKCIRSCVKKCGLKLNDREIEYEARRCFQDLGQMLKKRRQRDLHTNLFAYIPENEDPAETNPELKQKLESISNRLEEKVDELCEKYTRLQETGVEPALSEDSDDSNVPESDGDDDSS